MPVIVTKELDITAIYAQVRHITCEHCQNPFAYLTVGTHHVHQTGVPLFSSDQGMKDAATKSMMKGLEGIGEKKRLGEAMCPHCQCYQGWMVRWSRTTTWAKGLGVALLIGLGVGLLFLFLGGKMFPRARMEGPFFMLGMALSLAGGAWWALKNSLKSEPYVGMADSRAMTTNDLAAFETMCKEKDFEPTLAWYASTGGQFDPQFPVIPLPSYDGV